MRDFGHESFHDHDVERRQQDRQNKRPQAVFQMQVLRNEDIGGNEPPAEQHGEKDVKCRHPVVPVVLS
ncbi:hypothetical protein D3C81_1923460 [compost metagenome]